MKRKLLTIIAIVAVIFVSAVLWRVDGFIFGDRMNWAEAQGRGQLVAVHQALQTELSSLERIVYSFSSENFRREKINWNSLRPYYAVASLDLGNQGDIQTQNLFVKDKSTAATWNADFLNKAIVRIDGKLTSGNQIFIKPFQDGNKGRHVALLFINRNKAFALIGAGEAFQSLIDTQKGSLNSFSIVTTSGITAGHSTPEYVGTLLTEDPVFKVAKQSGNLQGVGVYDSGRGQKILGLYDQIANTNILILSSANVNDLMKGRSALVWQFVFLGLGLVLVGIAGILFVVNPHEKSLENLANHARSLVAGKKDFPTIPMTSEIQEIDDLLNSVQTGAVPAVTTTTSSQPALQSAAVVNPREQLQTKIEAYQRVASALGHEMRAPLTSILGYSQMVLVRTEDPDIVSSVESILRESRAARNVLEKLFSFAGEEELEKNTMKMEAPLARALKKLEPLLNQKSIKLEKDIQDTVAMPISVEHLSRAFENILTNSVEAMDRMPKKEMQVRLFENSEGIIITVTDSGEGIESADLQKVFDPFFTTRSFQNHTGLGLTVAMGIFREHGADVKVDSVRGSGTTVHITFHRQKELSQASLAAPKSAMIAGLPVVRDLPMDESSFVAPAPPTGVIRKAQEQAVRDLQEDMKNNQSPTSMNIDTLLDLPPAGDDELSFVDEKEESRKTLEQISMRAMDSEIPFPKVAVPKGSAPSKKSKLDDFVVEIPKPPGKRS